MKKRMKHGKSIMHQEPGECYLCNKLENGTGRIAIWKRIMLFRGIRGGKYQKRTDLR